MENTIQAQAQEQDQDQSQAQAQDQEIDQSDISDSGYEVYVVNLRKYNENHIRNGFWLKVTNDENEMQAVVDTFLGDDIGDEIAILDTNGFDDLTVPETTSLEVLASFVSFMEDVEDTVGGGYERFASSLGIEMIRHHGTILATHYAVEDLENFRGIFNDVESWARETFFDLNGFDDHQKKLLDMYFDFSRWADDLDVNGSIRTMDIGMGKVAIFEF